MRIWEVEDNRAIPSDLVREQDFILRVRRLQRLGTPHLVLNIVLNSLEQLARNRKALESAQQTLQEFARVTSGFYAEMSNGDAFIVWEETADAGLLASRLAARLLPEQTPPEGFLILYHMPQDYAVLRERANHYVEVVREATVQSGVTPAEALHSEAARGILTPWSVDKITKLLDEIDVGIYARSQTIYRLDKGAWLPVMEERFIGFEDLRRERFPKLEALVPEHLFLAVCEGLDQRFLTILTEKIETIAGGAVNLNLSVGTVMDPVFARFAKAIPRNERATIGFELHRGGLFLDFALTRNAIALLRQEGFRVTLDSITPDMLPFVDLAAFEADFIKINVAQDRVAQLTEPKIRAAIARLPREKIIFYRCDNETALTTGHALGIGLYQGWLIDKKSRA